MNKQKMEDRNSLSKNNLLILFYIIFTIFGLIMLFNPEIAMLRISYGLSILSIIIGIVFIVSYLISNSYLSMDQYGFSFGVLFVILGICAFFKANELAQSILTMLGIILVISSVLKLQYAVDLKVLEDKIWTFFIAVAGLVGICAILVLIFPFKTLNNQMTFTYIVLTADGFISLSSMTYLSIRLKHYLKKNTSKDSKVIENDTENIKQNTAEQINKNKSGTKNNVDSSI